MSDQSWRSRLQAIGADGYVTADEALALRKEVFADGVVSADELDALFALGDRAPHGDAAWVRFFAEAATDYYLQEEEPHGYLTDGEFETLKRRVTRDGHDVSALEVALLVSLLEKAKSTPPAMPAFVGEQIKRSILQKPEGPFVSKKDADLLRRYLFAAGGCGAIAVTRAEAELLFDLNDATESARNNPAWTELFVQGVINHLAAHLGYEAPNREEAFRRHAWASDRSMNVGGFFKKMVSGGFSAVINANNEKSVRAAHEDKREADAATAAEITPAEASWLAGRIGRDGGFDASERQLLERMREMGKDLPEPLRALLDRAA